MKARFGIAALVAALIWAVAIIAVSQWANGLDKFPRILQIMGGGAAATIILLGGWAAQQKRKDES